MSKSQIANLGGVFIYSEKPKELAEWYRKSFNLKFEQHEDSHFCNWLYDQDGNRSMCVFSILSQTQRPPTQGLPFRINFRVHNMKECVDNLKNQGVPLQKGPELFDQEGYFAWLEDPEGNSIELWEDGFNYPGQ